jgi:uncharacterized membrane protein
MTFPAGHTTPHLVNLAVHVVFGSAALLLGIAAIITAKGGPMHRRVGRWFLYSISVVLATALIGLLVFDFRAFLFVVTLLSFYDAFSGFRALQLHGARPRLADRIMSVLAFISPPIFFVLMHRLHLPWAPILTYSILGGLLLMGSYDLARNFLPIRWLQRTWMQEHLVKMLSAYVAISSAFAGTVFPSFMPWSAVAPTSIGYILMIFFLVRGPAKWNRSAARKSTFTSGEQTLPAAPAP